MDITIQKMKYYLLLLKFYIKKILLNNFYFLSRFTLSIFILFSSVIATFAVDFNECGYGDNNDACTNANGGVYPVVADFNFTTAAGAYAINGGPVAGGFYAVPFSLASAGQPRFDFYADAGTVIDFATSTGQDAEITINQYNTTNYLIRHDDDNKISFAGYPDAYKYDESVTYSCPVTGWYSLKLSINSCGNIGTGTKYWFFRIKYRPCENNQSYGSGEWNGYVWDGTGPDRFFGSIGTQTANNISKDWGSGQPISSGCGTMCDADNFSTLWFMNQTYSDGAYVFSTPGNDDGRVLSNNGATTWNLINDWGAGSGTSTTAPIEMNGNYNMVFYQRENSGGAAAHLTTCQMAGGNLKSFGSGTWNLYYYNSKNYDFTVAEYRGTATEGTSNSTSASLILSWGSGTAPTRSGQVCGTAMNTDFSAKALLTQTFNKGIYSVLSGADDYSKIKVNNGSFFNIHGSCCITPTTDQAFNGSTAIEYQMYDNGGGGSATVNITCQQVVPGTLSVTQACGSTSGTLSWSGGKGYYILQNSTDWGATWNNLSGESERNTVANSTYSKPITPATTTYYRMKAESCNGTPVYSNVVVITRSATYTGNVVIASNITLGGTLNITGDFTLNSGSTITVQQGCPLVINANNITINGTINANGAGYSGGVGGTAIAEFADCYDSQCSKNVLDGGRKGNDGNGFNTGANGKAGSNGSFGQGPGNWCGTFDDYGGESKGGGGGGGGGGGAYGGNGGAGGNGSDGGDKSGCDVNSRSCNPSNAKSGGGKGTGGNGGTAYLSNSSYDIAMGSAGSGGGGGGRGRQASEAGGVGGNGGGAVSLIACKNITISGIVTANGTNGGKGGDGGMDGRVTSCCTTVPLTENQCDGDNVFGQGGPGGGAGGGAGGGILLSAFGNVSITGTISATGGSGGSGGVNLSGSSPVSNAESGGGGGGGRIKIFTNPCATNTIPSQGTTVNNGTGKNNGTVGSFYTGTHPSYTALTAGTITSSSYSICYNTTPTTLINADASTGGLISTNAAVTNCSALWPAYQYQWYVTKTACASPTTGTGSSSSWSPIAGVTTQNMTVANVTAGITTVGLLTEANTYCFQRRTQSGGTAPGTGGCYAWTSAVSITILPDISNAVANFTIAQCLDPNNPYAELSADVPTIGSGTWSKTNGDGTLASTTANPTTITGLSTTGASTQVKWEVAYPASPGPACPKSQTITITPTSISNIGLVSLQSTASPQYYNCRTCSVKDGKTYTYYDNVGKIIAKVLDPTGSGEMGSTEVCIGYDYNANSVIPTLLNVQRVLTNYADYQPYLPRYWSINPTTKTGQSVTVTLYFTKAEYDALKANAVSTAYAFNTIGELAMTKYPSGSAGAFTLPASLNGINVPITISSFNSDYSVAFEVSSFSTFYIHPQRFPFAALPVELVSFTGYNDKDKNVLNWTTASERDADRFEVEKSTVGTSEWQYIGFQKAVGNNSSQKDYTFYDNNPLIGDNFYRLKMIDNDGTFKYSNTINIPIAEAEVNTFVKIFPNPTGGKVTVQIQSTKSANTEIKVTNLLGQVVTTNNTALIKGFNQINIDLSNVSSGTYLISFIDALGTKHVEKLIKE